MELRIDFPKLPGGKSLMDMRRELDEVLEDDGWLLASGQEGEAGFVELELEDEKINISVAYELSTMSEREQLTALDRARAIGRGPSIDEVKRLREELRTPEPTKAERDEPKPAEDGQEYKPGAYVRTEPTKMTTVPPDGKIVDFPAPSTLPPVEDAPPEETGREQEKDIEWAALMLKTLRNYCETMAAVKGGQTVPWAEYAGAVGIAIAALRK